MGVAMKSTGVQIKSKTAVMDAEWTFEVSEIGLAFLRLVETSNTGKAKSFVSSFAE